MWSHQKNPSTYPLPPLFHILMQAISFGSSWEYNNDCIVHKLDTKSIPYIPSLRFISLVKERKEENSVLGTEVILSVSYQGHGPESKKRSPTWFYWQILLVSTIGNVQRTVWRICILMLGCKGQVGKHSSEKKKKTFLAIYQVTGPEFQFTVVYCYSSLQLFNVLKRIMNRGR